MPQFDFSTALPQILWLILVFGALYLIVRGLLPRVDRVVENRRARIAGDLREAEAARDAAQASASGGNTALVEARARTLAVTGKARDAANAANARKLGEIDLKLKAQGEAAAASLEAARVAALAELDAVAGEATVELVQRVAGVSVSNDEAASAVKKVAA
jgi:F-type H+-transporting ATPase subunit b